MPTVALHNKTTTDGWGAQLEEWLRGDQYRHYARLRILENLYAQTPFTRMLDIGCGTGHLLQHFIQKGVRGFGIDNSPTIVSHHAHQRWFPASQADVNAMPFRKGSFDMLTCLGLIEHLDDSIAALSEMRRVTAQNGRALITVPRLAGPFPVLVPLWYLSDGRYRYGWKNMVGRMYTQRQFRAELQAAGWEIESLAPFKGSSILEWLHIPFNTRLSEFVERNAIAKSALSIMLAAVCKNTGDPSS